MAELDTLKVQFRDERGRPRKLRVWADAGRGYRGDFRGYADVGGGREALVPPGEHWATADPVVAEELAKRRIADLIDRRKAVREGRPIEDPRLAEFLETHLERKARRPRIAASTVSRDRLALTNLLKFSGAETRLSAINDRHVRAFIRARRAEGRSERTVLNELHALSDLWAYARADKLVLGENPVPAAKELEGLEPPESNAAWLETGEAVRLLAAAQALDADPRARFCRSLYPILATFLLTGGRKQEVLGLERGDVDFEGAWIHIRDNRWRALDRGLKSRHSRREVPLWPQLETILKAHLANARPGTLLFPSHRQRTEQPFTEIDHALAAAVAKAEIDKRVTLHTLRHTYTAHRLRTIEGGAPVSVWDVACELGHRDTGMIERIYGHVLRDRDRRGARADVVRYETATVLPLMARNA